MSHFQPTPDSLFFTKNDANDVRLGELFKNKKTEAPFLSNSFCLLGYPDDEGIKLNGGRLGAKLAPQKIREFLYKMTPAFAAEKLTQNFSDLGDLYIENSTITDRHKIAKNEIQKLYSKNLRILSLGGGHDYGYPDAAGFLETYLTTKQKPLVINIDAHLDVRPTTNGFNSGTPFYRLLTEYKDQFDFVELGIQPHCNSPHHLNWAKTNGAHVYLLNEILLSGGLASLLNSDPFTNLKKESPVFISFDIDGLTSSEAPGCSQSWASGLNINDYLQFFSQLKSLCNIRGLGIYEVSPQLDLDNRTSKTAAILAYNFLMQDF